MNNTDNLKKYVCDLIPLVQQYQEHIKAALSEQEDLLLDMRKQNIIGKEELQEKMTKLQQRKKEIFQEWEDKQHLLDMSQYM